MMQQDFLKNLESAVGSANVEIFVPSKNKVFSFKPLNLQQQKSLFKTSLDETFTKLQFNITFYNILYSNSSKDLNLNELYTFDRSAIAVGLRAKNNNRPFSVNNISVDLNALYESITSLTLEGINLESNLEDEKILLKLKSPNLLVDRDVNLYAQNKLRNNKDIQSIITELYGYEISKYVESIDIKATGQRVDFNTASVSERISAVEILPSHLVSGILEFIKPIREFENKILTQSGTTLEIDGSFFSV